MESKKMFKVISPIEKANGQKYWLRCGTAFINKDSSFNIYIDALPLAKGGELTLQMRELTEEDFARGRNHGSGDGGRDGGRGGFGASRSDGMSPRIEHGASSMQRAAFELPVTPTVASASDAVPF